MSKRLNSRNPFKAEYGLLDYKGYKFPFPLNSGIVHSFGHKDTEAMLKKTREQATTPVMVIEEFFPFWENTQRALGNAPRPRVEVLSVLDLWVNNGGGS